MIIFPAIDLKEGNCVRLLKGNFSTASKVAEDAVETAKSFKAAGASWLHMVDLDGAKTGKRPNRSVILKVIRESGLNVEIGGGIRDMQSVSDYIENGAARVILGSAALENKEFVACAVKNYGEKIAVGIDALNGMVAAKGWLETSSVRFTDFAAEIEQTGVKYIIFTDINRDGMLSGPNAEQLKTLTDTVSCSVTASGGIRDIKDIIMLRNMGLYGAICGKSIYSGTLDLASAVREGERAL